MNFEQEISEIADRLERASYDDAELWRLVNGYGSNEGPGSAANVIDTRDQSPVVADTAPGETTVTPSLSPLPPTFSKAVAQPNGAPPLQSSRQEKLAAEIALWRSKYKGRHSKPPRPIFSCPALKPWKRLTLADKLKRCLQVLWEQGECSDMTLHVDRKLMQAASKNRRGPVDYFYRRLSRELPRAFGHPVDFIIAGEISRKGEFHMHGVIGLGEDDYAKAKQAFWKACGKWDIGARQNQFKLRQMPDYGWLGYMLKENSGFEGQREGIVRGLKQKAEAEHDRIIALGKVKCNHGGKQ